MYIYSYVDFKMLFKDHILKIALYALYDLNLNIKSGS